MGFIDVAVQSILSIYGYRYIQSKAKEKSIDLSDYDAEALYNKFVEELPGCIDQIPEEGKMLLGAAVLGLQKAYEKGEKKRD